MISRTPPLDPFNGNESDDPAAVAAYVAELTADLARLARSRGLTSLGYLLEMARLEAETLAHRN